ncbi:MAG: energy-coupling factor ABC transporter ATP-binding protein, partial [Synergistaceae bacterium]|nr:energy-coupling factor ABC transporter ATP-binding protein [Synergistaceae bacterium]
MNNIYELRDVKFSYGTHPALDIKSLDIPRGGVVGLIGPNGSGKSTLLKLLAFLARPSSGKIIYSGGNASGHERELRREATLLLQEHYLLRTSVRKNVAYGLELRGTPRAEADAMTADSLSRVGLPYGEFADRKWFRLSGGEAQRVSLAARLALRTRVLLLDEPTANVDEASAAKIKAAIMSARNDNGSTVVVATHDLPWLYEVATAIVGMYGGRAAGGAANLLHGEWRADESEEGIAVLKLGESVFKAEISKKPGDMKCAAVDPSEISLRVEESEVEKNNFSGSPEHINRASGIVTQMTLERSTGAILAAVDCGGVTFRVRLQREDATRRNICPGVRVS